MRKLIVYILSLIIVFTGYFSQVTKNSDENDTKVVETYIEVYSNDSKDIEARVKNYIINSQGNKSEAEKIKWSKTFLDKVDIESLYNQYISNGGEADDLNKFANYITLNAPIRDDWEDLFKKEVYDTYGEKITKLEYLGKDLYQAYIKKNNVEIPYVVVSSRTGYFHG
ncbi:hypothetical protein CM240_2105 [Clostridium bornimense]|uniref:Uncharacterized protein n=1 Tax=Clostridium bornimense TaxID=1216932 RepID=W6S4J2_9CLOT|nr:hypothetical protein [Clostridium bornimense]CDM69262.1 hypothetical protein CM240_2105 [Clostridium bornimense]